MVKRLSLTVGTHFHVPPDSCFIDLLHRHGVFSTSVLLDLRGVDK